MRIETLEPSEKMIEVANMMKKIPGVKVRTLVREGTSYLVLEVSGIKNEEFEPLISRALSGVSRAQGGNYQVVTGEDDVECLGGTKS